MAEIFVSSMLEMLITKLAYDLFANLDVMKRQQKQLLIEMDNILAAVVVAEEKLEKEEKNIRSTGWLEKVGEAVYDLDDLVDEVSIKIMRNRTSSGLVLSDYVLNWISNFFLMDKVMEISQRITGLSNRSDLQDDAKKSTIIIRRRIQANTNIGVRSSPPTTFVYKIFGRDDDRERVLDLLIHGNAKPHQLSVISVIGMGGIGKTTLARMVYDAGEVSKHFDLRAWVSVEAKEEDQEEDDDFVAAKIGEAIVESVTGMSCQLKATDELDDLVRDTLESRRCLIVLDDIDFVSGSNMWMQRLTTWFSAVALGSIVLVTSRSRSYMVNMADKAAFEYHSYPLQPLSAEDSWDLFSHLAFDSSAVAAAAKISPIKADTADYLLETCRGIPLLLKLLGSLMRFQLTEDDWLDVQRCYQKISDNNSSLLSSDADMHYHRLLFVCYHKLPSHLKQCFTYCGIFPRNRVLHKDLLIEMWMAQGFIQSTGTCKGRPEDIGNRYLQELLSRSFLTDVKRDEFGEITEYGMHDLVHDFATHVAGFHCSNQPGVVLRQSRRFRQVSLAFDSGSSKTWQALLEAPKNLRSLLLFSGNLEGTTIPPAAFFRFKRLRVLGLSHSGIHKLSRNIGTLKHLRCLDLSQTLIQRLPHTITNLVLLQTLNLSRCSRLRKLPKRISNMTQLRNLNVSLCHSLSHLPSGIGQLVSLQFLPIFVLGKNKGSAQLGELSKLNLGGKLEIKGLQNVRNIAEVRAAKLYEKENLQHLGLSWDYGVDGGCEISSDLLLESLWPHQKLKVLEITGYNGIRFPSWIKDSSVCNLVKLHITNCSCEQLPPLGQLPYLQKLRIRRMTNLRSIGAKFYGDGNFTKFPSLQQIEFSNLPKWVEWSSLASLKESTSTSIEQPFPCLDTMIVEDCPQLGGFPNLLALKNLVLRNSNKKLLYSLANLTTLSSLVVNEYQFCFPGDLGNQSSIKKLMIHHCDLLDDSPSEESMPGFASVKHLGILYCNNLTSLPLSLGNFSSLQKLDLIECHNLERIPGIMESLPSLEELVMEGCSVLASLPGNMQYLKSLQKLIIKGCPQLSHLPQGLKTIFTLKYLFISGCPILSKRLEKGKGEDWVKIAHVPCIIIDQSLMEQDPWETLYPRSELWTKEGKSFSEAYSPSLATAGGSPKQSEGPMADHTRQLS